MMIESLRVDGSGSQFSLCWYDSWFSLTWQMCDLDVPIRGSVRTIMQLSNGRVRSNALSSRIISNLETLVANNANDAPSYIVV